MHKKTIAIVLFAMLLILAFQIGCGNLSPDSGTLDSLQGVVR